MILKALTFIHVIISLIGILSGLVVLFGLLSSKHVGRWTALFLTTTIATSATGFLFPFQRFLPSHAFGVVSLIVLALAVYALYSRHLEGLWRPVYVAGTVLALYLNVFVAIVQAFLKVPALKAIAPTQSELPFQLTQLVGLLLFLALGSLALVRFRNESIPITAMAQLPEAPAMNKTI